MRRLLSLSLCALLCWGCSKDGREGDLAAAADPSLGVTFTSAISTRVALNSFEAGDTISVAAYSGSKCIAANKRYGYDSYIFNSEPPIEYESAVQDLKFIAVYPARTSTSIATFDYTIAADQSAGDAYTQSDMLVSVIDSTQSRQPELLFDHVMSNVVINIISDESFDDAALTLKSKYQVSCNLQNQTYTPKSYTTNIKAAKNGALGLKAIVAPQTVMPNTTFATLTVGERVYEWTLLDTLNLESGRQYSFNWDLQINEVAPTGIINGWGDSASEAGTDIAYTRLSDYSATSYPETADRWVIYDIYANTADFDGLQEALNAISKSMFDKREITLEFPNLVNVPKDALSCSRTSATCLKRVSLPSVTIISENAFGDCASLETVNSPELISIKSEAFQNCKSLESVGLTKVTTIGYEAFYYCESILTLTLDSIVHVGSGAFSDLVNLVSISIPNAVTLGSSAFHSCNNLINIDIPNVTTIGLSTFHSCSSLTSISIPKLTTYNYESSRFDVEPFLGCGMLRSISISTQSTLNNCLILFGGLGTEFITLTVGKENAAFVNGNTFTTFDTEGATTEYTFYKIIVE